MKKLIRLTLACIMLLSFAACSDDDNGTGKDIELTGGTQTSQTIYADEINGAADGIKFSTTGAWQATVSELQLRTASDNAVDWLTLSQYNGDKAGDYTLTLTLKENYSGKDRKAEIKIISGNSSITITVEQKGTTESGEEPEQPNMSSPYKYFITQMRISIFDDFGGGKGLTTLTYNDRNQVVKIEESGNDGELGEYATISYANGQINYQLHDDCYENGEVHDATVILNDKGYIVSGKRNNPSEKNDNWKATYDNNGYLIASSGHTEWNNSQYSEELSTTIEWKDGNMISVTDQDGSKATATYTDIENNPLVNIDINRFISRMESWDFTVATDHSWDSDLFIAMDYYGKRTKNYLKSVTSAHDGTMSYEYEFDNLERVKKVTAMFSGKKEYTFEFVYK